MFGRKKKALDDVEDDDAVEQAADEAAEDDEADEADEGEAEEVAEEVAQEDLEEDEPLDEWGALDISRDWREDGPFDIGEVDLDADDVERLDFGSLVVTPFDGMQLQMQIIPASNQVQALLVMDGKSAIEVALFAAPLRTSMLAEVRAQMQAATEAAGGTMKLVKGPLGTEVRRKLKAGSEDEAASGQLSRTWLVQGPKWLLRGTLMGQAAAVSGVDKGEAQLLFEFFCNLVVRRGDTPKVPGELIVLDVPESVIENLPAEAKPGLPRSKKS
ncbi:MAG: DUF3710 domain-containing protein [Micrococcales bacterium]|nr:DUF3710 domain-containing protein [Micrococcales bacterium]